MVTSRTGRKACSAPVAARGVPGPRLAPLLLTDSERASLEALVRKRTASQSLALRARIVLACAEDGGPDGRAAAGRPAEDHRRPGRGRGHPGPDREGPRAGHAPVNPVDGRRDGPVAVVGVVDLAGLRPQAAPRGDVEAQHRPGSPSPPTASSAAQPTAASPNSKMTSASGSTSGTSTASRHRVPAGD
jgi:hypothetical protein